MSIEAVAWALNVKMPDAIAKLLLVGIANHAGDTDEAWPSKATLARYVEASPRTVIRKLHVLEEAGLIQRGDQQLVDHIRADRRPMVWQIVRGDRLSPREDQERGDTVLSRREALRGDRALSPQDEPRGDTGVPHGVTLLSPKPSVEPSSKELPNSLRSLGSAPRATRLDPDWMPSPELIAQMRSECPAIDVKAEHLKFVDYWISKSGRDATKLDWPATWRNWIRNARPTNGHRLTRQEERDQQFARMKIIADEIDRQAQQKGIAQ
jgi:Helix-turn-helix domain